MANSNTKQLMKARKSVMNKNFFAKENSKNPGKNSLTKENEIEDTLM